MQNVHHGIQGHQIQVLNRHGAALLAVSCDEAYLELDSTRLGVEPDAWNHRKLDLIDRTWMDTADKQHGKRSLGVVGEAVSIHDQVLELTGCHVSIGIGHSMLIARLATKKAKPAGIYRYSDDPAKLLLEIPIDELPGVGYVWTGWMSKKI
jgi:nucleotidyltransferase/DNA polymerase involved in DNA repair